MINFVWPQITCLVGTQNYGRFVIGPLENGYGTTLGNALRRVLLSSLDGAAVTSLRVAEVPHEFSTIPGVREDMMLFMLNVKQIRFRMASYDARSSGYTSTRGTSTERGRVSGAGRLETTSPGAMGSEPFGRGAANAVDGLSPRQALEGAGGGSALAPSDSWSPSDVRSPGGPGPMRLHLSVRGQGVVTAGDILCPPEIEVVNPELYLFTMDDPEAELDIEMTAEQGRGYSPAEERGKLPIGELPVDAIYSPIRKVNYDVSPARVGQMTNYDTLTLEIWTDGTLRPQSGLAMATELLIRHLALLRGVEGLEGPAEPIAVEGEAAGAMGRMGMQAQGAWEMGPMSTMGARTGAAPAPGAGRSGTYAEGDVMGGEGGPGHPVAAGRPFDGGRSGRAQGTSRDLRSPGYGASAGGAASRAYEVPIEELDLTVRVYNCLKRTGITKVGEVLAKMEKGTEEMLAIRNFGIKSLVELRAKLVEKGYLTAESLPDLGIDVDDTINDTADEA